MNQQRMRELLLGHALAEGRPGGDVLRTAGGPRVVEAAAELDAGRLAAGLTLAGIPEDEARLAQAWPASLRPAQRRLAGFPSRTAVQAQLVEVTSYLCLVALAQAGALFALHAKVLPAMSAMAAGGMGPAGRVVTWFGPAAGGLVILGPLLVAAAIVSIRFPTLTPTGERHRRRARHAAFAAALIEAGAPAGVRAELFDALRARPPRAATVAELDLVSADRLSRAAAAQRRLVALTRGVGLAALIAIATCATASVYHFLSWLPT